MELDANSKAILDAMREGINLIDTDSRIIYCNTAYRSFLERDLGHPVGTLEGRPLRELRPGALLPEVLKTGKPILHAPRQESEDIYFVNLYPVYQNGALTGGLSVITFRQQAYDFRAELEDYEKRSRQVLGRVSRASGARFTFDSITAVGPASSEVKGLALRIAATDAAVLLESESGTGKELYAQAIHNASPRRDGVFLAINCANFNANILESELFGYAEGAFTGAKKGGKLGLFEAADHGTLLLDEVSEMAPALQAKLLRVLQEKRFRPVGSVHEKEVDVRVVAACNADLERYVEEGKFRKDLFYRLNTFRIRIPPLRERREDIPALTSDILKDFSRKLKRHVTISEDALSALKSYAWPGNVRELRNVLEFSAYLSEEGAIVRSSLPENIARTAISSAELPLTLRVRRFEKGEIRRLLQQYGSGLEGKKRAAGVLGISLASLYNKLNYPDF